MGGMPGGGMPGGGMPGLWVGSGMEAREGEERGGMHRSCHQGTACELGMRTGPASSRRLPGALQQQHTVFPLQHDGTSA